MKVSYYSLGCKVNEYESIAIINEFIDHDYQLVDFNEQADVYIINTCTVTSNSDSKSRKIIRQATKRNPNAVIAVMGCFVQLNPDVVNSIDGIDVIVGTSNRHLLYELVDDVLKDKNPKYYIEDTKDIKEYEEIKIKRYANHTRGFIKIEDGCDNFCSYCAIPYARGRVRSRAPLDVIEEIQLLTNQGMKEIVLTGINTGQYGKDLNNYSFADLLLDIVKKVENLGRIRISSIEVTELTDELLTIIKENENHFCAHFHVPLQGGTDQILKKMNRKYDINFYQDKIKKLRELFVNVNITTDYLTGFAGETAELYEEGKRFVEKMNFGEMHIFPYSKRPNTKAYHFEDHVDQISKKFRVNELLSLNKEKALEYRQNLIGQVLEVIVEKVVKGVAFGHSSNYIEVEFNTETAKANDLCYVEITKANYPISSGKEVKNV